MKAIKFSLGIAVALLALAPAAKADQTVSATLVIKYYDACSVEHTITRTGTVLVDCFDDYKGFTPDDSSSATITSDNIWILTWVNVVTPCSYHYMTGYVDSCGVFQESTVGDTPGAAYDDDPPVPIPGEGPPPVLPPLIPTGPVVPA